MGFSHVLITCLMQNTSITLRCVAAAEHLIVWAVL